MDEPARAGQRAARDVVIVEPRNTHRKAVRYLDLEQIEPHRRRDAEVYPSVENASATLRLGGSICLSFPHSFHLNIAHSLGGFL
jgi:hypothetical protein